MSDAERKRNIKERKKKKQKEDRIKEWKEEGECERGKSSKNQK